MPFYLGALRMLNIATGYSKNTLPCSEWSEEHAGEGFISLRHILTPLWACKAKKCHFSRKFDLWPDLTRSHINLGPKTICAIARSRRGASTGFSREALRPSGADRQGGGGGRTNPARAKVAKHRVRARVNLRPGGGGCLNTPPPAVFRGWQENGGGQRRRVFTYLPTLPPIFLATFVKVSILGHARSGHQVRSSDHTLQKLYNRAPATVFEGKLWNLRNMIRSSVPTKCISWIFDIGDLRSGHFRDLPIIPLPYSVFCHLRPCRGRGVGATPPGDRPLMVVELREKKKTVDALRRDLAIAHIVFGPRLIFDLVRSGQRSNFHGKWHFFLLYTLIAALVCVVEIWNLHQHIHRSILNKIECFYCIPLQYLHT